MKPAPPIETALADLAAAEAAVTFRKTPEGGCYAIRIAPSGENKPGLAVSGFVRVDDPDPLAVARKLAELSVLYGRMLAFARRLGDALDTDLETPEP
jgi:hypothetical protein